MTDLIHALIAALFYTAALNSTPTALFFFPVAVVVNPWGFLLVWPTIFYLMGSRVRKIISGRKEVHANIHVAPRVTLETLANVPKVIAYYIYLTLWPSRLAFFHGWGKDRKVYKQWWVLSLSLLLCGFWLYVGFSIDPLMILWWFAAIGMWSQFIYLGQFIAERYTYLANVAWCVVLAKIFKVYFAHHIVLEFNNHIGVLPYGGGLGPIYWIIVTLYFCKSWSYAKSYYHNERLFSDSIAAQPEAPENYNNLACCYLDKGRVVEAIRPLHVALLLSKGNTFGICTNLANCYIVAKEYGKALHFTQEAMKQSPADRIHQLQNQKFRLTDALRKISRNKKKWMQEGFIVDLNEQ